MSDVYIKESIDEGSISISRAGTYSVGLWSENDKGALNLVVEKREAPYLAFYRKDKKGKYSALPSCLYVDEKEHFILQDSHKVYDLSVLLPKLQKLIDEKEENE